MTLIAILYYLLQHIRNNSYVISSSGCLKSQFPIHNNRSESLHQIHFSVVCVTKGFGPSPNKKNTKNLRNNNEKDNEEEEEDEEEEGIIPEIVTNRMISRMGLSVGIPLGIGLSFFPFFYYLKVGMKIDVPTWVPFIVSFFFFGCSLLGVSYGIVSASWDPLREGSLLGWTEAQKNWPVFWQSLRDGESRKN